MRPRLRSTPLAGTRRRARAARATSSRSRRSKRPHEVDRGATGSASSARNPRHERAWTPAPRTFVDRAASLGADLRQHLESGRVHILLADDHRIVLEGLRTLLEGQPDVEVVGDAEDGETAVRLASALAPNVVVIDISMPVLDGIAATRRIRAESRDRKIIVLSARTDVAAAERVTEAGANGYVCKEAAFSELVLAIRAVAGGTPFRSPRIANAIARARRT